MFPILFLTHPITVFQHKSVPFKIADGYKWIVILTNREHLEELSRAPEDQFSFFEAFDEVSITTFFGTNLY